MEQKPIPTAAPAPAPQVAPKPVKKFVVRAQDKEELEEALNLEGTILQNMERDRDQLLDLEGKIKRGLRGQYELLDQRIHHQKEIVNFLAQQIFMDYYFDGILTDQKYKRD